MGKPESLIMQEATIEMEEFLNKLAKRHQLSFFGLRIILNDFLNIVSAQEKQQNESYLKMESNQNSKKDGEIKSDNG